MQSRQQWSKTSSEEKRSSLTVRNRSINLNEVELRGALSQIVNVLYEDGASTEWTPATLDAVARILNDNKVVEIL